MSEVGELAADRLDAIGELVGDEEHAGAAVVELVA